MPSIIALIPARAGSKRVPGKNTRLLGGIPLIQWTIAAARASNVFDHIVVCSDDPACLNEAVYSKVAWYRRTMVSDDQPDIVWVTDVLASLQYFAAFALLRPTSPFRSAATIQRAWAQFNALGEWYSGLRAVQRWTGPHPAKMWYLESDELMSPVDARWAGLAPRHSSPTQSLPPVVRQTAALEMTWTEVLLKSGTISGPSVAPFFTEGYESLDINTEDDWREATRLVRDGLVPLPTLGAQTPTASPQ